ncbi:hypothetical protein [Alkalibacillus haloalkaliphilus]|uniref:hypothetical protein n=1 Tax=Alkalibacillus haloalkaliphilus TaxID=94136 RepID=UPI002935A513|nr:hypothetical protein [Alkalibacillus haloalkaliphilus]MDV2582793.1 hypothetical protein [Alkalibacillus haloalkaliphilus]
MKNLLVPFIFIVIVALAGCSNEEVINYEYTFIGESESWEAEYIHEGTETWDEEDGVKTYTNESDSELKLTYKGSEEDVQSIEKLEFSYDTGVGGGTRSREFDEPPKDSTFTISSSGTGAKVQEDAVIEVDVKWNDFEELFELVN